LQCNAIDAIIKLQNTVHVIRCHLSHNVGRSRTLTSPCLHQITAKYFSWCLTVLRIVKKSWIVTYVLQHCTALPRLQKNKKTKKQLKQDLTSECLSWSVWYSRFISVILSSWRSTKKRNIKGEIAQMKFQKTQVHTVKTLVWLLMCLLINVTK